MRPNEACPVSEARDAGHGPEAPVTNSVEPGWRRAMATSAKTSGDERYDVSRNGATAGSRGTRESGRSERATQEHRRALSGTRARDRGIADRRSTRRHLEFRRRRWPAASAHICTRRQPPSPSGRERPRVVWRHLIRPQLLTSRIGLVRPLRALERSPPPPIQRLVGIAHLVVSDAQVATTNLWPLAPRFWRCECCPAPNDTHSRGCSGRSRHRRRATARRGNRASS